MSKNKGIKVFIGWGTSLADVKYQWKTFKDMGEVMAWCRRNANHIQSIEGTPTYGEPLTHYAIFKAISGV